MTTLFERDALSRAHQFIELARKCNMSERDEYEMFVEAAIVYGRASIHRIKARFESDSKWEAWLKGLNDPSVTFFQKGRNFLLKEGPTKVGRVIRPGGTSDRAQDAYYFDEPNTPATDTVARHLDRIENILKDAE